MDIPTSEYDRYTVQEGDLLVCEGGEVGRCAIWSNERAVCGYQKALHRLRPRNLSWDVPRFMYYAFNAAVRTNAFDDGHQSTIAHLTGDKIRAHRFSFPPPSEQAAIVRFLDHANRRIRRYMRAKEKLIALLEEQKQAIIHQAVTGRIDVRTGQPYPAYKPSGVEWLGVVPAHWNSKKIKSLARPGYKTFVDGDWIESPYITSEGIRLIQTGNIGVGEYREKGSRYISEDTFTNFKCTEIKPGDILICRLGEPVARACLAPELGKRMITSVDVCILKNRADVHAEFLIYGMSSRPYLDWVGSLVRGSTRDRVSRSMLGTFELLLPPFPEQDTIVGFLDGATGKIDDGIGRAQSQISLLREYRTRLIADVVTGKLDVREAAAALPEVDPLAADDEADDPFDAGDAPAFDDGQEVAEVAG